jgi:hypothetical protein
MLGSSAAPRIRSWLGCPISAGTGSGVDSSDPSADVGFADAGALVVDVVAGSGDADGTSAGIVVDADALDDGRGPVMDGISDGLSDPTVGADGFVGATVSEGDSPEGSLVADGAAESVGAADADWYPALLMAKIEATTRTAARAMRPDRASL